MKDILFNSHDVVLMLTAGLSLILAARAAYRPDLDRTARVLLTVFLLLNACVAMDTLLFWGDSVKFAAFTITSWLPMAFAFASLAIGPVLLLFFQSAFKPQRPISFTASFHFLPALATPFYLYWVCFRHPLDQQADLILEQTIFSASNTYFLWFLTLKKFVPVIYGGLCVVTYLGSRPVQAQSREPQRGLHLYLGFPILWAWILCTHILGQWQPLAISDAMGIFSNYMGFTLTLALLLRTSGFTSVAAHPHGNALTEHALVNTGKPLDTTPLDTGGDSDIIVLSERIARFVENEKPYLNPQLTLDRFANLLDLSPRQVSTAINGCFRQNFNGYINRFRVEEARQLLHNPAYEDLTVMEIAQRAGFSSKATFNRIFKSILGTSPQVYRQQTSTPLTEHFHSADVT